MVFLVVVVVVGEVVVLVGEGLFLVLVHQDIPQLV